jgi:hypothetical protein
MNKSLRVLSLLLIAGSALRAQTVPTPRDHFGFNIGDDYKLATFTQTESYFKKLDASDRAQLVDIGPTEEGRRQFMLIVSSPANLASLDKYKSISQKLGRAEGISEADARALAADGKAVVWIDGGLHATETVGAHQLIETAYQLVSRNDKETQRILDNVIVLMVQVNPDGQELVSNWYMRNPDPAKRSFSQLPRLYQKYVGHDNNRDFFMFNMKESQNAARQQYVEWLPQIIYNHHQTGPAGSVLAGPPYRDPFNYVFDPLLVTSIDAVGAAMNNRLNVEGKPGYTQRAGSSFSTWWNGGLRTAPYFHNQVGLLTEIIGGPAPAEVPLVTSRLIPNGATPNPVTPREWHFRQSIDYSVSLNYAVLDYAARHSDDLLFNFYSMGRKAIEKGSADSWSLSPSKVQAINDVIARNSKEQGTAAPQGFRQTAVKPAYYDSVMKAPQLRDPRAYILSSAQPDFPTAVRFINALIRGGVQVHRASSSFTYGGKTYPSGSYVVKTAQAFRPQVLDMFEPQDHPNDFQYPGGPPVRPYDAAGWTLAYQMGVQFDRVLDNLNARLVTVPYGEIQQPLARSVAGKTSGGYLLDPRSNQSFIAINELLAAGIPVFRTAQAAADFPKGAFYVPAGQKQAEMLMTAARNLGVTVKGAAKRPAGLVPAQAARIALLDNYGGSMSAGWVRWILEQYKFPFEVVYPRQVDAGLAGKYDVLVLMGGTIPSFTGGRAPRAEMPSDNIPAEYQAMTGSLSAATSLPKLKEFLEGGGRVVTIGSSTSLAYALGLPVENALTETVNGKAQPLSNDKYYIPGSILKVTMDQTDRSTFGMPAEADVYFENSPVFKVTGNAGSVKPLAWFSGKAPLRSGWAWGQSYLDGGIAAFSAPVGKGTFYAFGPEITFRAQAHGTFKLLFNELLN